MPLSSRRRATCPKPIGALSPEGKPSKVLQTTSIHHSPSLHSSGSIIHSGEFFNAEPYKGKTVAIIGSGISGVDLATVLAGQAKQVVLVSRNGVHVFPRWLAPGKSFEWVLHDRHMLENTSEA